MNPPLQLERTASTPTAGVARDAVETAVRGFALVNPGRSVAVSSLGRGGLEVGIGADAPRPAASLLKLPLAAAVFEAAHAGQLSLATQVTRAELPSTSYPSILDSLEPDHRFTLRELCTLCLATSDNPIACHLLDLVGLKAVNEVARRWGCRDTELRVGFDDANLGGPGRANRTTTRDAVLMVVRLTADPRYAPLSHGLANSLRNFRLPLRLPEGTVVRHKTGTLPGVCNDVGVIEGRNTDLALAFLCEGEPDAALCSIEIGDCVAAIWQAVAQLDA